MPIQQNPNKRRGEERSETLIIPHITREMLEVARAMAEKGASRAEIEAALAAMQTGKAPAAPAARPAPAPDTPPRKTRLLAALCTGVTMGLGYGLIYMQNSSTGGADFVVMALKAVRPHLSLGRLAFITDVVIVLAGGFLFRDVDGIIYGMIVSFIFSVVIDKVMYGANAGKLTLIVTEHGKLVCDTIDATCKRGTTILKAAGGYKQEDKQVVMCACSDKQMYQVQQAVKAVDPASFMVVLESNEVHGEGFRYIQMGD